MVFDGGSNTPGHVTKADMEQELINIQADRDSALMQARQRFGEVILRDFDWWYNLAKKVAENPGRNARVQAVIITAMFDKICPDRKEISRGAATVGGALINFDMRGGGGDGESGAPAAAAPPYPDGPTIDLDRKPDPAG